MCYHKYQNKKGDKLMIKDKFDLKNWSLILFLFLIFLPVEVQAEENNILVNEWSKSSLPVYDLINEKEVAGEKFTYYDLSFQKELQNEIENLKEASNYSIEKPLLILNPYGTITNALYVYFESVSINKVEYSIDTLVHNQNYTFKQTVVNHAEEENTFEFQLIGLVPDLENHITFRAYDSNNNLINEIDFTVSAPRTESFYPSVLHKKPGESLNKLAEGLYVTTGTSGFGANTFMFDNNGIVRAELGIDAYRLDHLELYKGNLIYSSNNNQLAVMNPLGKIIQLIELEGYNLHHDFTIGKNDKLLVLASINDTVIPRREDLILEVDLNTGEVEVLIDLLEVFPEYYLITSPSISSNGNPDLDWIHINSIEKVSQDEILLSSRETSTIIKLSNIYGEKTELDYLIGPDNVREGTSYEDYLLEPLNDFPIQGGQHSLNVETDSSLKEGEYYITFYNNNYWRIYTRPELKNDVPHNMMSTSFASSPFDSSYYYKYLVNEKENSFKLVDSIEVPYSSIVSNVQPLENTIIINSGKANLVGEYDEKGELIAEFTYPSSNFTYRVFKESFENIWFE